MKKSMTIEDMNVLSADQVARVAKTKEVLAELVTKLEAVIPELHAIFGDDTFSLLKQAVASETVCPLIHALASYGYMEAVLQASKNKKAASN